MAHNLYIHVEDGTYDNRFIMIKDLSRWDNMLDVRHRLLQVLPPFLDKYIIADFPTHETMALNTINLGLSSSADDLPDGLYKIHYSVSPNDKIYLELCHYRVAKLMNRVLNQMSKFSVNPASGIDSCGNIEVEKNENTLLHIWMMLKGAQAVGKDAYSKPKADELYKQSMRIYDKLFDENCKNC